MLETWLTRRFTQRMVSINRDINTGEIVVRELGFTLALREHELHRSMDFSAALACAEARRSHLIAEGWRPRPEQSLADEIPLARKVWGERLALRCDKQVQARFDRRRARIDGRKQLLLSEAVLRG